MSQPTLPGHVPHLGAARPAGLLPRAASRGAQTGPRSPQNTDDVASSTAPGRRDPSAGPVSDRREANYGRALPTGGLARPVRGGGDPDAGLKQPGLLRESGLVNLRVTASAEQMSADELLSELSHGGFVPGLQHEEVEGQEDDEPLLYSFLTAVETVCWKPV